MLKNTVGLFAHLWHGHKTRDWSRIFPILGLVGGVLMAPAMVLAAGQWTAQLTGNNPPLGPFSTKEQAVQALEAAAVQRCASAGIPCPAESTTMQQHGVIAMTPNGKTYSYIAITPSTPTSSFSCYVWSAVSGNPGNELIWGDSSCFPDEASAVAAQTSMPGCFTTPLITGGTASSINHFVAPAGDWSQLVAQHNVSGIAGASIIEGSSKAYTVFVQNPLNNNCATTPPGSFCGGLEERTALKTLHQC
jgi:hypothetical protein